MGASNKPLFSIMGDSISTYAGCNPEGYDVFYEGERKAATGVCSVSDTWWARMIDLLGGRLLSNASFSGSMVEGAGFPAGDSQERVEALGGDGLAPDAIVVFMGINDYGWGGAKAQAAAGARAVPAQSRREEAERRVAGRAEEGAIEGFAKAYSSMLLRIRERYPEADIWCCTLCPGRVAGKSVPTFAWKLRGVPLESYNDAIRSAAAEHGCALVDFAAYGLDYDAIDGTHPTKAGMKQLAAMAVGSMASQRGFASREAALLEDSYKGFSLRSRNWCEKNDCIDCAYAKATGNAWYLVCENEEGNGF